MDQKAEMKLEADSLSADQDVQICSSAIDPVKEKKLLRKLDLCICPLVMVIFLVAYLDRSNVGYVSNVPLYNAIDESLLFCC